MVTTQKRQFVDSRRRGNFISRLFAGQWFSAFETGMNLFGASSIMVLIFLVTADVIGRYAFNNPLPGQMEITEMLMIMAIFSGMAYTQRVGGHVRMDVFCTKVLKGRLYHVNEFFTIVLSLLSYAVVTVYSFKHTVGAFQSGSISIYLGIPLWPAWLFVPIGSFILCIRFFIQLFQEASSVRKGGEN